MENLQTRNDANWVMIIMPQSYTQYVANIEESMNRRCDSVRESLGLSLDPEFPSMECPEEKCYERCESSWTPCENRCKIIQSAMELDIQETIESNKLGDAYNNEKPT